MVVSTTALATTRYCRRLSYSPGGFIADGSLTTYFRSGSQKDVGIARTENAAGQDTAAGNISYKVKSYLEANYGIGYNTAKWNTDTGYFWAEVKIDNYANVAQFASTHSIVGSNNTESLLSYDQIALED